MNELNVCLKAPHTCEMDDSLYSPFCDCNQQHRATGRSNCGCIYSWTQTVPTPSLSNGESSGSQGPDMIKVTIVMAVCQEWCQGHNATRPHLILIRAQWMGSLLPPLVPRGLSDLLKVIQSGKREDELYLKLTAPNRAEMHSSQVSLFWGPCDISYCDHLSILNTVMWGCPCENSTPISYHSNSPSLSKTLSFSI